MFDIAPLLGDFQLVGPTHFIYSVGGVQIAKANPRRGLIVFSSSSSGQSGIDLSSNLGSNAPTFSWVTPGSLTLNWSKYGILCTMPWYWYGATAGQGLTVTEVIWQP